MSKVIAMPKQEIVENVFSEASEIYGTNIHMLGEEDPNLFPIVHVEPTRFTINGYEYDSEDFKSIIDERTGRILSVMSDVYEPVPYEKAILPVEEAIIKSGKGNVRVETNLWEDGKRLKIKYIFQDLEYEIMRGDNIQPSFEINTSLDGGNKFMLLGGAFRLVCSNGLVIGEKTYSYKRKHMGNGTMSFSVDEIVESIEKIIQGCNQFKDWAEIPATARIYNSAVKQLNLSNSALQEIDMKIEEEGGEVIHAKKNPEDEHSETIKTADKVVNLNLWKLYNTLTWHSTHKTNSTRQRAWSENKIRTIVDKDFALAS